MLARVAVRSHVGLRKHTSLCGTGTVHKETKSSAAGQPRIRRRTAQGIFRKREEDSLIASTLSINTSTPRHDINKPLRRSKALSTQYLIPVLLGVQAEHGGPEHRRVHLDVRGRVRLRALQRVEDLQQLRLDEVDEDKVDRRVVRDACGRVRPDEVGHVVERL